MQISQLASRMKVACWRTSSTILLHYTSLSFSFVQRAVRLDVISAVETFSANVCFRLMLASLSSGLGIGPSFQSTVGWFAELFPHSITSVSSVCLWSCALFLCEWEWVLCRRLGQFGDDRLCFGSVGSIARTVTVESSGDVTSQTVYYQRFQVCVTDSRTCVGFAYLGAEGTVQVKLVTVSTLRR